MFKPKKSLGQNFLINPHIVDKIVASAEVSQDDIILEVGPGTGNLTKKLAEKAKKIIAIEKDRRLIEPLKETFKNYSNIEIVEADILKFDHTKYKILDTRYKIVANIPYYITSRFLRTIFENWPKPKLIILTIQKEVAQRIVANPPHMNLLALSVQFHAEPEIVAYISKNNFRPAPRVDSAIIKLVPRTFEIEPQRSPEFRSRENQKLFKLIKIGFSEKRKQLASLLSKKLKINKEKTLEAFKKASIAETVRAENLSLKQWQELSFLLFSKNVL